MNVEEYLRNTYNNVQDLGHGWYCQVGSSDYSAVYVPKNYNGNMAMVIGFVQIVEDETYDYLGVNYPGGVNINDKDYLCRKRSLP